MMEGKTIGEAIRKIKSENTGLDPCTGKEIERLESFYNVKLPDAYKCFLLIAGNNAGNFMLGSDYRYDSLFKLKEYANHLLAQNNKPQLPGDAFVFWMHQGYQFCFFYLQENENPTVYYFNECEDHMPYLKPISPLSDFLFNYNEIL